LLQLAGENPKAIAQDPNLQQSALAEIQSMPPDQQTALFTEAMQKNPLLKAQLQKIIQGAGQAPSMSWVPDVGGFAAQKAVEAQGVTPAVAQWLVATARRMAPHLQG
jgi:hypothetical protein